MGTPISLATQSVSRLQSMVAGLRTAPSENLMQIFKSVFFNGITLFVVDDSVVVMWFETIHTRKQVTSHGRFS